MFLDLPHLLTAFGGAMGATAAWLMWRARNQAEHKRQLDVLYAQLRDLAADNDAQVRALSAKVAALEAEVTTLRAAIASAIMRGLSVPGVSVTAQGDISIGGDAVGRDAAA